MPWTSQDERIAQLPRIIFLRSFRSQRCTSFSIFPESKCNRLHANYCITSYYELLKIYFLQLPHYWQPINFNPNLQQCNIAFTLVQKQNIFCALYSRQFDEIQLHFCDWKSFLILEGAQVVSESCVSAQKCVICLFYPFNLPLLARENSSKNNSWCRVDAVEWSEILHIVSSFQTALKLFSGFSPLNFQGSNV